jgi:phosphogluconate dehydratase
VPAVIHVSPEALLQGPLGKVRTGDTIVIDAQAGVLDIEIDGKQWAAREVEAPRHQAENEVGFGRELFGVFRSAALPAEQGASVFGPMVGETDETRALYQTTQAAHVSHATH